MTQVGQNIPHDSAMTHVTGESIFIDDTAPQTSELTATIVPSPVAAGKLTHLDISAALAIPGVRAIITAVDLGKRNYFGPVLHDERLLVESEVDFLGQPVAIIAAETRQAAELARRAVVAKFSEATPILTIDQAIAANSFLGVERKIQRGDLDAAFASADHVLEGTFDIGGQEHFYLETQAAIVVPAEQNTFTIHSSTQHPSEVQTMVAEVLGVPFNHVTCLCKRMGGGFGGKETQASQPAMFAALLAQRTRRPVRFVYDRDDDMAFTGKRHPFKSFYRVAFSKAGKITALDVRMYSNGGCSTDLSFAVLERAMLHTDNAYFLPAVRILGRVCKTHLPSNTAFRGFGGPQGVASTENIVEQIALELGKDATQIRQLNLYSDTPAPNPAGAAQHYQAHLPSSSQLATTDLQLPNITPYGQVVRNNTLGPLFTRILAESDYHRRRAEITAFNATSRFLLKGLAISPVKFGISFTRRTLNQANALVLIYLDGSVLVTTGATEMGQGVHTRIRQLVADELGLPLSKILIGTTTTDKNNNTSPTAASTGTDLNGAAAVDACSRLKARLAAVAAEMLAPGSPSPSEPLEVELRVRAIDIPGTEFIRFESGSIFDSRNPDRRLPFQKVVCHAYELRVSLGERGFYATPGVDFNRETGRGTPFLYYTNGVACAEVAIDRFTGESKTTRVDLIMDAGVPINPGIDRGQIIGGFIQGQGWVTTEELVYLPNGTLQTHSPDTYKIPAISDVPPIFNVSFFDNPNNTPGLRRHKSVGEPPLLLGLSVWLALKNAISYLSAEGARTLSLPATPEKILLATRKRPPETPAAPLEPFAIVPEGI